MPRAILQHVVQDQEGDVVPGALVDVLETDGVTPIVASLYAADSGGSPLGTNVLTANSLGLVQAFADVGQYVTIDEFNFIIYR